MVKKILRTTDPKLRTLSKPVEKVDKKLLELIRDLEETLKAQNDPEGLGLAAPQIGVFQRVFILQTSPSGGQNTKGKVQAFINPEIVKSSAQTNDIVRKKDGKTTVEPTGLMEGCLSLPHYYGPVRRANKVTLRYATPRLETDNWKLATSQKQFSGFMAHTIQHEIDHLEGIYFIDRLLQQKRKLYQLKGKEWIEIKLI